MNANAPKNEELDYARKILQKYGRAPNGNDEKESSLPNTHYVAVVEIRVKYPIIPTTRYMEDQNISTSPVLSLTATSVIEVSTSTSFSVPSVRRLGQSQKVLSAIRALKTAIESELYSYVNSATDYGINLKKNDEKGGNRNIPR